MNPIVTIKHWSHDHNWHHKGQYSDKLTHSPLFWLILALLAFVVLMVFLGYFTGGNPNLEPYPYFHPYGVGPWPIYP